MTEPPRLLHSTANPRARALLEAGLPDAPRRGAALRTAVSLGLSASVLSTVTVGTASAAAGSAGALGAPVAGSGLLMIVAQWLAIGIVSGIGLAGGANWVASPTTSTVATTRPSSTSSPASALRGSRTPLAGSAFANEVGAPLESSRSEGAPSLTPAELHPASTGVSGAPSAVTKASERRLAREVALIDEARRALAAGNAELALGVLDAYAVSDRTGTLDRESQVLRINALLSRGEPNAALSLARAYLNAYPSDPHSAKLRALVNQELGSR